MWDLPRARAELLALALLALLAPSAKVHAQDLNYNTFLIGTRAMGMGGAFTGIADDPSTAYHNPAGLGLLLSSATSANLSVIAIEGYTIEGGYGSILGPRDLEHDAIPSLPIFVGFGQKFGDRDRFGVRQHGIALSVVRPALIRRSFEVDVFDAARGIGDSIRIEHEESQQWYGVSYGIRLSPGLAIGVGGWVALRELRHEEEQFVAAGIIPVGASRTADRLLARQSEATASNIDLVFRVGFLWQIDPQWRFGAMIQPAGISISNSATISNREGRTGTGVPPAVEELSFVEQDDLASDYPLPWQLRVGASHAFTDDLRLALDVALYAPIGSAGNPVETFGAQEDPVTGEMPSPGRFIPAEWHANITANVAVGLDVLIADVVPLQAGIFTDLSAAPSIDGPSAIFQPAQVHGFGASLAGGFHRGDFDVQIGAAGVFGWGTGLGTNPDPNALPGEAYLPRSVQRYTLYFFISGTERAAASLVREILGDLDGDENAPEAEQQEQAAEEQEAARQREAEVEAAPADVPPDERSLGGSDADQPAAAGPKYLRSPWADLATE